MQAKKKTFFDLYLDKVGAFSCALKLISVPTSIVFASLLTKLIEISFERNIEGTVQVITWILLGVLLTKAISIIIETVYEKMSFRYIHNCKIAFYKAIFSNSPTDLFSLKHGEVIQNFTDDFNSVVNKKIHILPDFFAGIIAITIFFLFLALQDFEIALVLLLISFVQIIPPILVKKYMNIHYDQCRKIEAQLSDFLLEGYKGFATIKLYQLKSWWMKKMFELHKQYRRIGDKSIYTSHIQNTMSSFLTNLLKYGTYLIVGVFVLCHKTTLDIAIQAIALSGNLYAAVNRVFALIPSFSVAEIAQKRIASLFISAECEKEKIKHCEITLTDVSVSYEEKNLYDKLDLALDGKEITLIKGQNGSGKSTLLRLIAGLIRCDQGQVNIGGVNSDCISYDSYPNSVFYLPQADLVFDFPSIELIEMMAPNQMDQVILTASEFGLTRELLENRNIKDLSGGERKKVYLSLAFVINPEILLLDEPTNSLDEAAKKCLIKLLVSKNGGAVIITHDDLFDDIADKCYYVEEGELVLEKK